MSFFFKKKVQIPHDIHELSDSEGHKIQICRQTGRWVASESLTDEEKTYLEEGEYPLSLERYTPSPNQIIINVTDRCNLNCVYCYASDKEKRDISEENFCESMLFLGKIAGSQNCTALFTGGEAMLMWDKIYDWIQKYREKWTPQLGFSMQTNGTLITDENAKQLRRERINVGVSIDGPQLVHDANRSGSYNKVMQSIEILHANNIECGIRITVIKDSAEFIPQALQDMINAGMNHFTIGFTDPLGRAATNTDLLPTAQQRLTLLKKELEICVKEFQKGNRIEIHAISQAIINLLTNVRPSCCPNAPCGAGISLLGIDVDGYVYPCDYLFEPQLRLGHVTEFSKVVTELERNPELNDLQYRHEKECELCPVYSICCGGCRVSRLAYDRLQLPFPNCQYMKEFVAYVAWMIANDEETRNYAVAITTGKNNAIQYDLKRVNDTLG